MGKPTTGGAVSDGPNARAKEDDIGQSAGGLPNDSSQPVEVDPAEEARIRAKLLDEPAEDEAEAHPS